MCVCVWEGGGGGGGEKASRVMSSFYSVNLCLGFDQIDKITSLTIRSNHVTLYNFALAFVLHFTKISSYWGSSECFS